MTMSFDPDHLKKNMLNHQKEEDIFKDFIDISEQFSPPGTLLDMFQRFSCFRWLQLYKNLKSVMKQAFIQKEKNVQHPWGL